MIPNTTINSMIDDLLFFRNLITSTGAFTPIPNKADVQYPVEVKYNDDHMIFEYSVAGIPKEEISVETEEDRLIITHEKSEQKEDDGYTVIFTGITKKEFRHVWKVNPMFNMDEIKVVYFNGILSIIIPKKPEKKKKTLTF